MAVCKGFPTKYVNVWMVLVSKILPTINAEFFIHFLFFSCEFASVVLQPFDVQRGARLIGEFPSFMRASLADVSINAEGGVLFRRGVG